MNKTDASQFATKTDIKDLRSDINRDLKAASKSLRTEILKVEERVENIEEGQQEIKTALVKLQNTLRAA